MTNVSYDSFPPELERSFLHFLRTFRTEYGVLKYVRQAEQVMSSRLTRTIYIDVNDIINYCVMDNSDNNNEDSRVLLNGPSILMGITEQYGEYKNIIDNLINTFCKSISINSNRVEMNGRSDTNNFNYTASFYGLRWVESLRTLRCEKLGKLTSLRGTITRTSDVRPELLRGCFECEICGCIVDNVLQQFVYSIPSVCPTKGCGNRSAWQLRLENSDFGDWQKIRIQEHANEIPPGSMPRSMNVILRGDFVDKCKPGDKVVLTGTLIVAPDVPSLMKPGDIPSTVAKDRNRNQNDNYNSSVTGLKSLGVRDLAYRLCFLACHIEVVNAVASVEDGRIIEQNINSDIGIGIEIEKEGNKEIYDDENNNEDSVLRKKSGNNIEIDPIKDLNISEISYRKFLDISQNPNGLSYLSKYIAPHVYGYSELKKGILLQLVGGVEKKTKDNIKLRGDINLCIVGDPSTAKSQILRFVHEFSTRTVYTSGKSSTAAGLTASVHRDPDQGDFVIEAGALMLADKGICCIDEFDKMDDKDVVAIHEAMEQQTISITKAGVLATLNARASVLAACSPIGGRYNTSKTLSQNVRISAPILSRFDLFFVMTDDPEDIYDEILASFIVNLHSKASVESRKKINDDDKMSDGNNEGDINKVNMEPLNDKFNNYYNSTYHGLDSKQFLLTKSEVSKYINFAKTFKPCITSAAKTVLVRTYKALRISDSTSGAKAMRITVRQLESLIRLSEAVAKLRFSYIVTPEHVEEACSVFKSSLSKIRHNDIDLGDVYEDNDEEDEYDELKDTDKKKADSDDDNDNNNYHDQENDSNYRKESNKKTKSKKQSATIGYNEYFQIARRFVTRIQDLEKENDENIETSITELITWHISEFDHPESEEELNELEDKYNRAIMRMIHRDMILYITHQEEIPNEDNDVLVNIYVKVHPNYNVDESISLPVSTSMRSSNKPLTRHADFGYRTFINNRKRDDDKSDSESEEDSILNLKGKLEPEDFFQDVDDNEGQDNIINNARDGNRGNANNGSVSNIDDLDRESSQNGSQFE
ncbi:hypothetical protein FG379_001553 [Cryptosporidium bovis]|uniref:uncharacterized protein n=1 Tax=Cryptosporidium bovis TaxID=310047 RepID=UPI00351A4333|nr:hypothetical protein FG379_001553 [Cryptosporidium bovis]